MSLRVLVILVLCGFGLAPGALLMSFNAPVVRDRLDRAAQHESLLHLQNEQFAINVKVERLKERVSFLASLPDAGDILAYQGEQTVNQDKAVARFADLANKCFGNRDEITAVGLLNNEGHEQLLLEHKEGSGFVQAGQAAEPGTVLPAFCMIGAKLAVGDVWVSNIERIYLGADGDGSVDYVISLVTPVAVNGETAGIFCCRINMADFFQEYALSYWLDGNGEPLGDLGRHGADGPDGHKPDAADVAANLDHPGLNAKLADNKAFVLNVADGRKIAWQPVIFNKHAEAAFWLGHPVDRSELESWLEGQQMRVLLIACGLVLIIVVLAGRVAVFIDRRKQELLEGFDAVIAGDQPRPLSWKHFREMRQLAAELNVLTGRYFDMRVAWQSAENELRENNTRLEEIVEQRTSELYAANEQLSEEVEERSRVENELIRHRDHLEDLVKQRLVELAETNEQLQLEMVRRKHAQDSVRKNEARLRVILDSVPIGIFIVDREKKVITYANPAAAAMIGVDSPSILHGEPCYDYFCEDGNDHRHCIDDGDHFKQLDITLKRVDASPLSVLKTIIPLNISDRPCLLESITDITELKRISKQNQTLHEQLLQSQKMEAVGVLAGGVAHDFNNLLTVIQGSAELALLSSSANKGEQRYLGQIKETTERAGNLVRQLLLFSRTQPMTLTVLNLNNVVENLLKMLIRLIGEDIDIITELDPQLWSIEGNAANIEQVIMNLSVNGRDAMLNGGKLYIRTSNTMFDHKNVPAVTDACPGRFVCLEVADNGGGIDNDALQRIFEPFFTTKEAGKGTGLGLAVVYGIVKHHNGWIDVVSEKGHGTTFKIYLPCSTQEAGVDAKESMSVDLQGGGKQALVVEDEETLRGLIADTLEQRGFTVLQAVDAAEALEILEREKGGFGLLFSDVVLPGEQNGIQLANFVSEKYPGIPVILSSGYTDQKSQWSIIDERGFAFLQKPFTIGDLERMVYEVIKGKDFS